MKIKFQSETIPSIVTEKIVPLLNQNKIILLEGPLGAGKTTLTKEILLQLGVIQTITSPTFTYVNTYRTNDERIVYHFDLYRIDSEESFFGQGFNEYLFEKESICIIEWPQVIQNLLNTPALREKSLTISLQYDGENMNSRVAFFKKN